MCAIKNIFEKTPPPTTLWLKSPEKLHVRSTNADVSGFGSFSLRPQTSRGRNKLALRSDGWVSSHNGVCEMHKVLISCYMFGDGFYAATANWNDAYDLRWYTHTYNVCIKLNGRITLEEGEEIMDQCELNFILPLRESLDKFNKPMNEDKNVWAIEMT